MGKQQADVFQDGYCSLDGECFPQAPVWILGLEVVVLFRELGRETCVVVVYIADMHHWEPATASASRFAKMWGIYTHTHSLSLLCSHSSFLEDECLLCAIIYWNYVTYLCSLQRLTAKSLPWLLEAIASNVGSVKTLETLKAGLDTFTLWGQEYMGPRTW